jgi:hypothetical protein
MTRYFLILLMLHLQGLKGQSVCIDSATLRTANSYLVKGAIARQKVSQLMKVVQADSIIIDQQDSIIIKQKLNIGYLKDENKVLVKRNKAISRTLKLFKSISIGLFVLTLVGWLK